LKNATEVAILTNVYSGVEEKDIKFCCKMFWFI